MVLSRTQLEQLDRDALIDYAESMSDIKQLISVLAISLTKIQAENLIIKNCNTLIVERADNLEKKLVKLEKSIINTSQYSRNRQIEQHRFPEDISNDNLTQSTFEMT